MSPNIRIDWDERYPVFLFGKTGRYGVTVSTEEYLRWKKAEKAYTQAQQEIRDALIQAGVREVPSL